MRARGGSWRTSGEDTECLPLNLIQIGDQMQQHAELMVDVMQLSWKQFLLCCLVHNVCCIYSLARTQGAAGPCIQ
jgi:hypothetical protein